MSQEELRSDFSEIAEEGFLSFNDDDQAENVIKTDSIPEFVEAEEEKEELEEKVEEKKEEEEDKEEEGEEKIEEEGNDESIKLTGADEEASTEEKEIHDQEETDTFLEPDVLPEIPSMVSEYVESPFDKKWIEHERRISGDFAVITRPSDYSTSVVSVDLSQEEEEGHAEAIPEPIEEEVKLDRKPYYAQYDNLYDEIVVLEIKNNFWQKKMVEYYKKRKMDHVFKETESKVDTNKKYFQKLDGLWNLLDLDRRQRLITNAELDELRKERDKKLQFVNDTMKQLLDREREISSKLIHSKTGKEIPEKMLEHLFQRQRNATKHVAKWRLKLIKIRNRVNEKQEALHIVDRLGNDLRLIDYEELKIENKEHSDKLEEREAERLKLKTKYDSVIHTLAHFREKSAGATLDIIDEEKNLRAIEAEYTEARERKNYFKSERDRYRAMINRLKENCGILFKPKLIQDMENSIKEAEINEQTLKEVKDKQKTHIARLRAIRKNIELMTNYKALSEKAKLSGASSIMLNGSLYKGRPKLIEKRSSQ